MYEEKRFIKRKINWVSVLLKLLLLFLVVFLIWFLIFGRKNDNKPAKKGKSMEDNLKVLKKDSIKYFDKDKLPKNIGEVKRVTLEDMIKNKATKEVVDKNGKTCSKTSSYSQVTKVDENNYSLKVYIKCKNEADSIITSISTGKKTNKNNNTNTNNNKTNNNTNNNNKTNNNTNTSNNNSTKKTTTTNKTTNKTTKETSTVKISGNTNTNNNTNTTVATNNNTNTNTNSNSNTNTTQTTEFVPTQQNLLYTEYELVKYGEWTTTKPETGKFKTQILKVVVNKYCYGNDNYNCHTIPKMDKYKNDIDFLLAQGYREIYDHTNQTYVYLPYEAIWSKTKDVDGYTYTGRYRDVHKMN